MGILPDDNQVLAAPVASIFQVPYPSNPLFVGREEELKRLVVLLNGTAPVALLPALSGTGGIGETELVAGFSTVTAPASPAGCFG